MDAMGNRTVRDLLDERSRRYPDSIALVHESPGGGTREFTYRRLVDNVRHLAAGLQQLGVRRADRVAILLPNTPEFIFTWLASAWIGAVAVPLNTASTVSELRHVADLAEPVAMITTRADRERLQDGQSPPALGTWVDVEARNGSPSIEAWLAAAAEPTASHVVADDVAQLVFTSGTSARPKAVMLTHANHLNSGERESRVTMVRAGDRLLSTLPLFHVNAQSNTLLAALTVGATAVFLQEYSASRFWEQTRRHGATHVSLVAMQVRTLLAQPASELDRAHGVRGNIYAINVSDGEKDEFERRFGLELMNGYGLSEAMTVVTAAPLHGDRRWPSIGLPAFGREVRIVDEDGAQVPPGSLGELVVGGVPGKTLMLGYFRDPEATAASLRDGWLYTGDVGYIDEKGYLYFVDRAKDVIKRAGENISCSEVESVLLMHSSVVEAAVIGVPDEIRDEAVKAFVVLREGEAADEDSLRAHCMEHLSHFKVPTLYEYRSELPRTSVGKIQKKLLRTVAVS